MDTVKNWARGWIRLAVLLAVSVVLVNVAQAAYRELKRGDLGVLGKTFVSGGLVLDPKSQTCYDDDAGTASACTISHPYTGVVLFTCSDANGCALTLSETGAEPGALMKVVNLSSAAANVTNVADTATSQDLAGAARLYQYDWLEVTYVSAAVGWAETDRNVNAATAAQTCWDNDAGTANTCTIGPPYASTILLTCSDANNCTMVMAETGAVDGQVVRVVNMAAGTSAFSDTSGVTETTGTITLGQYDSIAFVYATDRWVELGTSNN